jgi:arginyl-tRNA synthetase
MLRATIHRLPVSRWGRPRGAHLFSSLCSSQSGLDDVALAGGFQRFLDGRVRHALAATFDGLQQSQTTGGATTIGPATRADFGDYQCNVALSLAKELRQKPRQIAETLAAALEKDPQFSQLCETPLEIAGPGFINVRLQHGVMAEQLGRMHGDTARSDVATRAEGARQRIIVDFSSPNIAKEMHVGHLRSTIIGDTLSSVLGFLGHDVLRLNHVGDWGTQFGMLIGYLRRHHPEAYADPAHIDIGDLVQVGEA